MFDSATAWITFLAGFGIITLASRQIGDWFARIKLPLITGYLVAGIIAGPYLLKVVPPAALEKLRFVDELALAYIAFAAGSELIVRQLRSRFKAIRFNTYGQVMAIMVMGASAFFLLSDYIPFAGRMPMSHRAAVALMAGAILVARSPSSAMAVVNELRAKGPFTKTALGVTVIMDVVVITLFSICVSIAGTVLAGQSFDARFALIVIVELSLSFTLGYGLGKAIPVILARQIHKDLKTVIILAAGYGIFLLSEMVRHLTRAHLDMEILFEPMLVCMIASFVAANFTPYRTELMKVLHDIGPLVYVAFFTLTGASLQLDVLAQCWMVALALFAIRALGIFAGSLMGGVLAGEPMKYNRIAWMAYITQAGVSLGLAKQVSVEFPQWGATFTTLIIAVIVLNQIVGPPLFKWVLYIAKEAHPRAEAQPFDGVRDAVIFGLEGESLALARLLHSNQWEVKMAATRQQFARQKAHISDIEIHPIADLNLETLNKLGVAQADSIVAMLSDEENHKLCELVYENFGTRNFIVRLNNRAYLKRFHQLGALVVDPSTAMVNLLDQFVRSPSAATLLMGLEKGRDIIEFEMRNPDLHTLAIRDLVLPLDIHILSIRRGGQMMVTVGFTRLQLGDWLTVVGSRPSLEQMMLQFSDHPEQAAVQMVGRATSRQMADNGLAREVEEIMHDRRVDRRNTVFDRLVEESMVLDLDQGMTCEAFFRQVATMLSAQVNVPGERLFQLFMEREMESSTALRPDLAIPHVIIEGEKTSRMLLARCRPGIYFSELAPAVKAVFVLLGTRDQRNDHLYALSAIAETVQQTQFQERWLRARNEIGLRNIVRGRGA